MMPHRRYLTFSLRTLFILLTALAVWLGVVVNRAREQREAVKAIEALGGRVRYDWQRSTGVAVMGYIDVKMLAAKKRPSGPAWIRQIIGDDFFQSVLGTGFADSPDIQPESVRKAIPHLRRLGGSKHVSISSSMPECIRVEMELKAALPSWQVHVIEH